MRTILHSTPGTSHTEQAFSVVVVEAAVKLCLPIDLCLEKLEDACCWPSPSRRDHQPQLLKDRSSRTCVGLQSSTTGGENPPSFPHTALGAEATLGAMLRPCATTPGTPHDPRVICFSLLIFVFTSGKREISTEGTDFQTPACYGDFKQHSPQHKPAGVHHHAHTPKAQSPPAADTSPAACSAAWHSSSQPSTAQQQGASGSPCTPGVSTQPVLPKCEGRGGNTMANGSVHRESYRM